MTGVLIVGAGPTGMTLGAQVRAHGAPVRIVERRDTPQPSHAFVVQPRTLEVLAPLGLAATLVERGDRSATGRLHAGGRSVTAGLAQREKGDTAYPFLLAIPQAMVEEALEEHLRSVDVAVEHGVELVSLRQVDDAVECVLRRPDGRLEQTRAAYVVGCDGRDSTVRRHAGIGFPSSPYRPALWLADLDVETPAGRPLEPDVFHGYVGAPGILFLFPSPGRAPWRLLVVRPARHPTEGPHLGALQAVADEFTGGALRLHAATWASEVHLVRGQAAHYRVGRVLLAGDAAHVHSPAGAQGMNTGIQDACNLGWKLALVARGDAPAALLDSYEAERWPVARRVRQLTDLAFVVEAADLPGLRWLRRYAPRALLGLVEGRTLPAWLFRLIGGLLTRYRRSPAVEDSGSRLRRGVRAGDRLVDGDVVVDGHVRRLHDVLRPPGFHLLLCGAVPAFDPAGVDRLRADGAALAGIHHLTARPQPGALADVEGRLLRRLLRGASAAVYLIRPDGYVGYCSPGPDLHGVGAHLGAHYGRRRGVATPA